MSDKEEVLAMEICECGEKTVAEAIDIFIHTTLPYKKAKKLVTECNKTCCRHALTRLFDMVHFGRYDYDEIAHLITLRHDKAKQLLEGLKSEG